MLFWHDNGRDLPPVRLREAALRIRHVHDARIRLFGANLSTDSIGSIPIGIYLAEAEGRNIELDEIAAYAGIATSTATRWVAVLSEHGIIDGQADAAIDCQLTRLGLDRVEAMLTTVYEAPDAAVMPM